MSGYSEALRRADFRQRRGTAESIHEGENVDVRIDRTEYVYPERIVVQLTTGRAYVFPGDTDPSWLFGGQEIVGHVGTVTHGGRYVAERNAEVAVAINPESIAAVEIER